MKYLLLFFVLVGCSNNPKEKYWENKLFCIEGKCDFINNPILGKCFSNFLQIQNIHFTKDENIFNVDFLTVENKKLNLDIHLDRLQSTSINNCDLFFIQYRLNKIEEKLKIK